MIIKFIIIIVFGLFLFSFSENNLIYYQEFNTIIFSYFVCSISYFFATLRQKIDVFHGIHLVSFLYFCLFIISPLVFIINDDTALNGVPVMQGCQNATLIFTGGYLCFLLGYSIIHSNKNYMNLGKNEVTRKTIITALFFWGIGFISSLYFLISSGFSLIYIFTFGSNGVIDSLENQSLFLINFTYFMIAPAIYLFFYSKNKFFGILIFVLTLTQYMIRGTRFIIVIFFISIFIFWYRKRNSLPSIKTIVIMVLIFVFGSAYMQYFRNSIKTGNYESLESNKNSSEIVLNSFVASFDIYKPFYGLVAKYPNFYPHTFGKGIFLDPVIMFMPRTIWKDKPLAVDFTMPEALEKSVGYDNLHRYAMAWPNIAEYYMDFGVIGTLILMFIFGLLIKKSLNYYYSNNMSKVIFYAILFPLLIQIVSRGFTAGNLGIFIFLFLPIYFINKTLKVKNV